MKRAEENTEAPQLEPVEVGIFKNWLAAVDEKHEKAGWLTLAVGLLGFVAMIVVMLMGTPIAWQWGGCAAFIAFVGLCAMLGMSAFRGLRMGPLGVGDIDADEVQVNQVIIPGDGHIDGAQGEMEDA